MVIVPDEKYGCLGGLSFLIRCPSLLLILLFARINAAACKIKINENAQCAFEPHDLRRDNLGKGRWSTKQCNILQERRTCTSLGIKSVSMISCHCFGAYCACLFWYCQLIISTKSETYFIKNVVLFKMSSIMLYTF